MNDLEYKVNVPLTLLEASLIKELRNTIFGEITVFKQRGQPIRIEVRSSIILKKEDGMTIEDSVVMPNESSNKLNIKPDGQEQKQEQRKEE